MTIPALPSLERTSPTFRDDLDTFFLTQLPNTVTELNSELTRIDGIVPVGFVGTSTASLTVAASGTIALTVQANRGFAAGQRLVIAAPSAPSSQMRGYVTTYTPGTGELVVAVDESSGSGTFDLWSIAVTATAASPYYVGDVLVTNRTLPPPGWLPADGAIYSQASYPALYAELGLLRNGVFVGSVSGITGLLQNADTNIPAFVINNKIYFYAYQNSTTSHYLYRTSDGSTVDASFPVTLPVLSPAGWYNRAAAIGNTIVMVPAFSGTGNNFVACSTDAGATFSKVTIAALGAAGSLRLLTHESLFVLIISNSSTSYFTSPDGLTWTSRTLPANCGGFVSTNGVLIAMATAASTSCYTSTDGINWSTRTLPSSHTWRAPIYNSTSGVWLIHSGTNGGPYARSTDNGATWATVTSSTPHYSPLTSASGGDMVTVFGGKFVIAKGSGAGTYARLLRSDDGLSWSQVTGIPALGVADPAVTTFANEIYFHPSGSGTEHWVSQNLTDWRYVAGSHYLTPAAVGRAAEANNVQVFLTAGTTTHRRPVYTYNTATQFVLPSVSPAAGVTVYIKA